MPGWDSYKDLARLIGETAFSAGGNAFFDVGSLGAEAVSDPLLWAKGFGNEDAALEFSKRNQQRRSQLPELDVSPRTEELQDSFLAPLKDVGEAAWEGYQDVAPEGSEAVKQYFSDPRVMHTLQSSIFAAPSAARVGGALRKVDFMENMATKPSGTKFGGRQAGMAQLTESAPATIGPVTPKDFKASKTKTQINKFAELQNNARNRMNDQDRAQVDAFDPNDFNGTVYLTKEGDAGFSLTKEGYLGHVFKDPDSPRGGVMSAVMTRARGDGAKDLDAFDTYLAEGYKKRGAVETDRFDFDPEQSTEEIVAALGAQAPSFVQMNIGGVIPEYKYSKLTGKPEQAPLPRYTETATGKPVKRPDRLDEFLTPENLAKQKELMKKGVELGYDKWYHTGGIIDSFITHNPSDGFGVVKDFMGYGAGMSPRSTVAQELKRASYLNFMKKKGYDVSTFTHEDFPPGYGHKLNANHMKLVGDYEKYGMPGDPTNPIKAPSYFVNKMGNFEPYTIDGHDYHALTGKKASPKANEYPYIEEAESKLARELGLDPAEGQSAKWGVLGAVDDPRNLTAALNMRIAKTATETGLPEEEVMKQLANRDIILRALLGSVGGAAGAQTAMDSFGTEQTY